MSAPIIVWRGQTWRVVDWAGAGWIVQRGRVRKVIAWAELWTMTEAAQ